MEIPDTLRGIVAEADSLTARARAYPQSITRSDTKRLTALSARADQLMARRNAERTAATVDKARRVLNGDIRTIDPVTATPDECRSASLELIDRSRHLSTARGEWLNSVIEAGGPAGDETARRVITFGGESYRSAYGKKLSRNHPQYSNDELAALGRADRFNVERALDVGNTQGVPIDVDPLIHEASAERPLCWRWRPPS